jgi:prephenate dehydrogenase
MARLAILGFGLIGGSVARAIAARDPDGWRVTVWSRSAAAPRRALEEGVIADVADDPVLAVAAAELVLLAASPAANIRLVARVGPAIAAAGGLLSDVTGVQAPMATAAAAVPGLRFVGGHPLSGRETRGYGAATADLFVARPWAVLPGAGASRADVELVRQLAVSCGALPLEMSPAMHDRAVAAISHLPLLTSVALVEALAAGPGAALARSLAAQGWRDTTRLARGDPELGAGMLALNAAAVADALRRYRARLDAWQARLDGVAAAAHADAAAAVEGLAADLAAASALAGLPSPDPS